ncbi:MAG: MbcA/ParS/Xre antitoxin family protein [Geminicoccaceae bacterium]
MEEITMALATPRAAASAEPDRLLHDPGMQAELIRGFFGMMRLWQVENADARRILGDPAERTFYGWKGGKVGRLPADTVRRVGYVAGIFKALQILYPDSRQADQWIRQPNRHFGGQTPLARMAAGDVTDLAAVRAYLDAARAPWS